MLELLLKLIDRIIQFQDRRSERKQTLFKDIVEPSFDEISAIYSDYRKMLASARQAIEQDDIGKAIHNLESDRELYLATRTKLASMATVIRDNPRDTAEPEDYAELVSLFLADIGWLIMSRTEHGQDVAYSSRASTLAAHLREHVDDDPGAAIALLDSTLTGIEEQFQSIATSYSTLRASALLE